MGILGGLPLGGTPAPGTLRLGGLGFALIDIAAKANKYQGEETFMVDTSAYGQIALIADPRLTVFSNHIEFRIQLTAESSKVVNIIAMENVIENRDLLGE